jgi:hypothetical protein
VPLFLIGAGSFGVAFAVGLLIRGGRKRQLALALVGVATWSVPAVYSIVNCGDGFDCSAGVVFAAVHAAIWLAGVGAAALVRRDGRRPGRHTLAAAVAALVVVGASAAFASNPNHIFRWGCPSSADIERPWSVDEVVEAFEDSGLPLEPTTVRPPFPRPSGARAYRGAQAFVHRADGATLHVVVCREQCSLNLARASTDERRRLYRLAGEARPNVVAVVTDVEDPRAADRLRRAIDEPLRELDRSVGYGSRCYIR